MADLFSEVRMELAEIFDVERVVGSGGMATVFLATEKDSGRQVALKVLSRKVASRIGRERFLREIQVGSSLDHPHIVSIYKGGEVGNTLYLSMPWLSGPSLGQRLEREGRLEVAEAIEISVQIADALQFAHDRGIVHRDIKPENIMFSESGAQVMDFGVALAVKASLDERLTLPGQVLGTPTYMSPEQAMARFRLDEKTDIYSLGCVCFEMLVGRPPFEPTKEDAILVRTLDDPAPDARKERREVPKSVSKAIIKALAWKPAQRHKSASEFAKALR
ncbi:MAG: serine/threonine protein kinase [Gemmatimonadota bacterium]|nr:serine/threonine protein kinase [Gemmatimonadota bacterium]